MKVATVNAIKSKRLWAVYKLILTNVNLKNILQPQLSLWRSKGLEVYGISQADKRRSKGQ